MIDLILNSPPVSLIINRVTATSENSSAQTASNLVYLIHQGHLILEQQCNKVGNNLSYSIFIVNNIERFIYDVSLKDILPEGVNFVSTFLEDGQYRFEENEIFYDIPVIKPHSFSKIVLNVNPTTLGEKINLVDVLGKKAAYASPNPCTLSIIV